MNILRRVMAAGLSITMLAAVSGCGAKDQTSTEEETTLTGTLEEVKDFMFILTDEDGVGYSFDFETPPADLDQVEEGDKVTVTYTGQVSQVDPFSGTIISIEKSE